jgi:signal transduction histidine kinase
MLRRLLITSALPALLAGQVGTPGAGLPFIRNFPPPTYAADAQNWALAQDLRGVLFAGNNSGVLEFDGVRWRLIPTASGGVVRSLAVGPDGRVYVGSVGEFGVLEPDATARLAFVTLSRGLKACPGFSDVWATLPTPDGIVFQSREALFRCRGGRVEEIKAATSFHTAFAVDRRVFVRQREVGLQELKGSRLVLVPGGERFRQESVFAMMSLEGGGGPGGILVGSRNQGLFRLTDAGIVPFPTPADAFLKANALYQGIRLQDGSLALATLRGGVLLLDPRAHPLAVLDRARGLLGDAVKNVLGGQGPVLWMALDTGLARAEMPSPFSVFDERNGLSGQVWDLARQGGRLYAATGAGVFVLTEGAGPLRVAAFRPVEGPRVQCTSLLPLDRELLVASGQGLFTLREGKATPLRKSSESAISLLRSRRDPDRVFESFQGGIALLRRDPGSPKGWREEGILTGLTEDVYSMAETADGSLWAGTLTDQVLRIRFPEGWKGGPDPRLRIERFGSAQGISGATPFVALVRGELTVGTKRGFLRFQEASGRFVPDPALQGLFPGERRWIHSLMEDGAGRLWVTASDEQGAQPSVGFARPDGKGGLAWTSSPFQRLGPATTQVVRTDPGGVVWLGGSQGILRYDPAQETATASWPFGALVRKVGRDSGAPLCLGEDAAPAPRGLPYAGGGLRFEFAAPAACSEGVMFQTRLLGYERDWSPWSPEAQKEYTRLFEGRYEFQVRARDIFGRVGAPATFRFTIAPPTYRRWWAWMAYAAALALGARALLRIRTRRLRQRNVLLQARITEATWELQDKERRLEAQTADLARMNRELRDLDRQKDEFLGIVVHDLRNPLNGMLLTAELMLNAPDPAETEKRLRRLLRSGEDMNGLITRFLDIAAIDAGRLHAHPEPLSAAVILQEVVAGHQEAAWAKGITLASPSPGGLPPVLADRRFLKEVLDNLVSNALKFSPRDTRVELEAERRGAFLRFTVRDQGPGLTAEDRSRLFERYMRLSARPTAGEPSAGLGLSIVKALTEAMGGRVHVESEAGHGAAFHVELPAAPAE